MNFTPKPLTFIKLIYRVVFLFLLSSNVIITAHAEVENEIFNALNISYFGKSVTRPGLKVGTNLSIHNFKPHIRANGDSSLRQIIFSSNAGMYYHFRNHYGMFLNGEAGFRVKYPKGFFWQFDVGAGYLRTFLDARVYEVSESGEVHRVYFAGSNQFMPGAGITLGKDLSKKNKKLEAYHFRIGGFLQYPYNTMWLPNIVFEMGVTFNLKSQKKNK